MMSARQLRYMTGNVVQSVSNHGPITLLVTNEKRFSRRHQSFSIASALYNT